QPLHRFVAGEASANLALVPSTGGESTGERMLHGRVGVPVAAALTASQGGTAEDVYVCTVRDVTERRRIEEQLFAEKMLAQVTLASIGDGVITTAQTGQVRYLNPSAEKLTGWRQVEAQG